MNVNEYRNGARVRMLRSHRMLGRDFPGWGHETDADFTDCVPGDMGTVTNVESHASNPWTRYAVRLDNGSHTGGLVDGTDFAWA